MVSGPVMCRNHALLCRASATVALRFLAFTVAKTVGVASSMLQLSSHLSIQKIMDSPFPSMNTVATWNTPTTAHSFEARTGRRSTLACHS
jgi:hypothetical protein